MDERKTTGPGESTPEQPAKSDAQTLLEQAFARGSGHLSEVPSPTPERTEHSVMEGLPPAKAERIAAMRRELAELQRQLTEAQQRIATELQGRAEDAERLEALEARLQAHETKAQQDTTRSSELVTEVTMLRAQLGTIGTTVDDLRRDVAARDAQIEETRQQQRGVTEQLEAQASQLNETKTLLATRDGELATRTAERDTEQATRSRLERELDEQRTQHRDVTSQLEAQVTSVRDANALIATRDTEVATLTAERDALKSELAAARAKAREVASQLARFAQELTDGGDAPGSSAEPPAAKTVEPPKNIDRPKPPPVPLARASQVETILEVTEEPRSKARTGLVLVSGLVVGALATFTFAKLTSSSPMAADEHKAVGDSPSAALVAEHAPDPTAAVVAPDQPAPSSTEPAAENASERPAAEGETQPAAAAGTDGVIVLPQAAADHRLFVDNRVVPVKNSRAVVACGSHEIRIGSRGTARTLDVACGGETVVPADPRDR